MASVDNASPNGDVPVGAVLIPAGAGVALRLPQGRTVRVINTHGTQVIDTWAFCDTNPNEFMSMEHTRAGCKRLVPAIGEHFLTNTRSPILTLVADSSPGVHDTLIAACDSHRYRLLGHPGYHANCTENLAAAMSSLGIAMGSGIGSERVPCPLNLFMNTPPMADGTIQWLAPEGKAGDAVDLRAEQDCIVVFSACPMDMLPINGQACVPHDAHYVILSM